MNGYNHLYYPQSLELPGYLEPEYSVTTLLVSISSIIGLVLCISHYMIIKHHKTTNSHIAAFDIFCFDWFIVCGCLHGLFELYYLLHFNTLAATPGLVAGWWKEYAKSDSRYLTQNSMVFMLELITVSVTAPLCWMSVWSIWKGNTGVRYTSQLVASVLHLYSCSLYFGTEFIAKESSCRPENVYYWGYLVIMNLPWIVVPVVLGIQSIYAIYKAMLIFKYINGFDKN